MTTFLINQLMLAGFNLINSRLDAYRIIRNKNVAHGANFGAYAFFAGLLFWLGELNVWQIIIFFISAFCNRQFTFDIPLNLRRGLAWDYVTKANPPQALMDKIEIRLFGYNGRAPFLVYGSVWVACLIIKIWV